ncbi:hypothetical protein DITRI_Ditri03aG0021500 [Diplodiscus trichospermus]
MAGTGVFAEILGGDVYRYYVDGEWKESSSGKTIAIINPTTRKTQYKKRTKVLHKAATILKEHKAPVAEYLVKEIAKPAKDAVTEVVRLEDLVSYYAEEGSDQCRPWARASWATALGRILF